MDALLKRDLAAGRELYEAGDYVEAEAPLRRVLAEHDDFADVHNMVGVIAYQQSKPDEAANSFARALELNPRYNEAALNYSVALNELGRYEEAREVYARFTQGRETQPAGADELDDFVRGKIANLHAKVAEAYVTCGLFEPAIVELRAALDLCPTFVDLRLRLGVALRDAGLRDDALTEMLQVRESRPNYVDGRIQLGLTFWSLGQTQEARDEWEKVLLLDGQNRRVKAYLAMAKE